jgi:hypothetical protein
MKILKNCYRSCVNHCEKNARRREKLVAPGSEERQGVHLPGRMRVSQMAMQCGRMFLLNAQRPEGLDVLTKWRLVALKRKSRRMPILTLQCKALNPLQIPPEVGIQNAQRPEYLDVVMEMGLVRILILFRIGMILILFRISPKTGLVRMNRIMILILPHPVILLATLAKMQKVAAHQRALQHGRMSGRSKV